MAPRLHAQLQKLMIPDTEHDDQLTQSIDYLSEQDTVTEIRRLEFVITLHDD